MAYTRLNKKDGDIFNASDVTHIEDGIVQNESDIAEVKDSLSELDILGESGITSIPDGDDIDNYTTPGKYNGSANVENIPYSMGFTMLIMKVRGTSNIIQIFFSVTSSLQTYMRLFNGTVWYNWLRISTVSA